MTTLQLLFLAGLAIALQCVFHKLLTRQDDARKPIRLKRHTDIQRRN